MSAARASESFAERRSNLSGAKVSGQASPDRRVHNPLAWLNLVCLDAPLVAVSWEWLFARSFGIAFSAGATCVLFLTAWLIYLADRFGDASSVDAAVSTSLRQRFCLQHRFAWISTIVLVTVADLLGIITQLNYQQLVMGAAVGTSAAVYLLVNRVRPSCWRILPLKELSIGCLFAAGSMVPLAAGLTSSMWPSWILFACLCSLNCIAIAAWERFLDLAQQRTSIATVFPGIGRLLIILVAALCAISLTFALSSAMRSPLHFATAASAALLALIHLLRTRIPADARTALADLVLLTPLLWALRSALGL